MGCAFGGLDGEKGWFVGGVMWTSRPTDFCVVCCVFRRVWCPWCTTCGVCVFTNRITNVRLERVATQGHPYGEPVHRFSVER